MKQLFWIVAFTCSGLLFEYLLDGILDKSDILKSIILALVLTFGKYCADFYINDNQEKKSN